MDRFEHFALAAATGSFVENRHHIVVWSDYLDRGRVRGNPPFLLSLMDEYAVDSLLCTRTWLQGVSKDFVRSGQTVMSHDLAPVEVRVPKRGRQIDDRLRPKIERHLRPVEHFLQVGERPNEECRVPRRHEQC